MRASEQNEGVEGGGNDILYCLPNTNGRHSKPQWLYNPILLHKLYIDVNCFNYSDKKDVTKHAY